MYLGVGSALFAGMALVNLSETDCTGSVEVHTGDTIELALPESPESGYRWRWRLPVALRVLADEHVRGGDDGAAGHRRLAFDVNAQGQHELRAELALPWESSARHSLTFVIEAS